MPFYLFPASTLMIPDPKFNPARLVNTDFILFYFSPHLGFKLEKGKSLVTRNPAI